MEIAFVLGLLVLALILFATEKLSVDIITLILLVCLVMSGILTPVEAFSGFSDPIIIILASIFVIGGAMRETGMLEMVGKILMRVVNRSPRHLLPVMMTGVGGLSAFMNNTTVTAMFTGPLVGLAKKIGMSPSRILMPMAFASILGGTCTLVGTSTNVAVSGYISKAGMAPIGLFEITPVGIVVLIIGVAYMSLIGYRLLPDRQDEGLTADYQIRSYVSEIVLLPASPLIGQSVLKSDLGILGFQILKIIRGDQALLPDTRDRLREGDVLLVAGNVDNLMKVSKMEGIEIHPALQFGDKDLQPEHTRIAEVLITPRSNLLGRSLKQVDFRQHFGLAVLAIYRKGHVIHDSIGAVLLQTGDMLLVQGSTDRLNSLQGNQDISLLEIVLSGDTNPRGLFVLGVFVTAIVVSGIGWVPLSIAILSAALLMVLTHCLPMDQIYQTIDFKLLVLIGGMTAFGTAMSNTGSAEFLANWIIHYMEPMGTLAILAGFIVLTVILTQPMSNAAAALVVLPVALQTASQLHLNERTFAIAIMLGASISLITPFEPSCVIVYGPGKYKFRDFVKAGSLLTAILIVVLLIMIPMLWPLYADPVL